MTGDRPRLAPAEQISEDFKIIGKTIAAAVHNLDKRPRSRPVIPISERNRPRIDLRGTDE